MTYAIVMIKGESKRREDTLKFLSNLKNNKKKANELEKKTGTKIGEILISFGWPDFILLLRGSNVELLKETIVYLKNLIQDEVEDTVETSTIVCATPEEIEKAKKDLIKKRFLRKL